MAINKKVKALLGNEAIVYGALESDLRVAAAYPGTPSTEIGETLSKIAMEYGVYFEWSTNEKVAVEVAAAASWSGLRSLVAMKHVGFNVASDAIYTLSYAGVKAGMVIVCADDPSAHSSQNEQDNRHYAVAAYLPMVEPSSPAEAKRFTVKAFEISEDFGLPVMIRTTTRLSHSKGPVEIGVIKKRSGIGHFKPESWDQYLQVGAIARKHHKRLIEQLDKIAERFDKIGELIQLDKGSSEVGIITSGVSYGYSYEAKSLLGMDFPILKLGLTNPFPTKTVADFLKNLKTVVVVEELDPYIELKVKAIAKDVNPDLKIVGKLSGDFHMVAEYTPRSVLESICKALQVKPPIDFEKLDSKAKDVKRLAPPRPPILCPGCPHRATGYVLRRVLGAKPIYVGDIGCYALLFQKPFRVEDITHAMGSSVGFANGFSISTDQDVVALIGDSTFFHAGIPSLINAVHNKHKFLLLILDNRITAMTGHQSHPGVPYDAMGREAPSIDIAEVVKAIGVKYVRIVDPYDFKRLQEVLKEAIKRDDISVIISRRECALLTVGRMRREGKKIRPFRVNPDKCTHCLVCINTYACPAFKDTGEKVEIDPSVCFGCGSCVNVCPFNAIEPSQGAEPWFKG